MIQCSSGLAIQENFSVADIKVTFQTSGQKFMKMKDESSVGYKMVTEEFF